GSGVVSLYNRGGRRGEQTWLDVCSGSSAPEADEATRPACLLHPQKQTSRTPSGKSASCHNRTHAPQQTSTPRNCTGLEAASSEMKRSRRAASGDSYSATNAHQAVEANLTRLP